MTTRLKAAGLTIDELESLYFDADALIETPRPLYRIDGGRSRFYYALHEQGQPRFYVSATSLIDATVPKSEYLIKWMTETPDAEARRDDRAAYGTLFHVLVQQLLITRKLDVSYGVMELAVIEFCLKEGIPARTEWVPKLQADVLAVAQWIRDAKVKPLAIEVMLASDAYDFAGAIDLVCEMNVVDTELVLNENPKSKYNGQMVPQKVTHRIRAIVDFKSGGIYESHAAQLGLYRALWNESFPSRPVERLFNVAPKAWETKPSYTCKEQTDQPLAGAWSLLVALYKIVGSGAPSPVRVIEGVIELDAETALEELVTQLETSEMVRGEKFAGDVVSPEAVDGGLLP